jgi:hypothetical protein
VPKEIVITAWYTQKYQLAKVQKDIGLARFDIEVNDGKTVLCVLRWC